MTSMPASRNARAITLAPRSCPSSPGLATSTRILRSAIAFHLTTHATGAHRRCVSFILQSLCVQALPQIPASHAAVWLPALCDFLHLFRGRQPDFFLAAFFCRRRFLRCLCPPHIEIVLVHRHANAEIAGGQHVLALQREHRSEERRVGKECR